MNRGGRYVRKHAKAKAERVAWTRTPEEAAAEKRAAAAKAAKAAAKGKADAQGGAGDAAGDGGEA